MTNYRWLYLGWAHILVVAGLLLNFWWLYFAAVFLVPKFQKSAYDGVIDLEFTAQQGFSWMPALLDAVYVCAGQHAGWFVFGTAVLIGLFEWFVRSPNKTTLRLLGIGTLVFVLSVVSVLVGVALAIPSLQSGPVTSRMAGTFAKAQVTDLGEAIDAMEQALRKEDWEALQPPAEAALRAVRSLDRLQPAVRGLWSRESPSVEEMRALVKEADAAVREIREAMIDSDAPRLERALATLRKSYEPLREAAQAAQD